MNFNRETIDQLSKLSDEELTTLLKELIAKKQADGTIEDVEKMVRMISPFLSSEQKTRLTNIIRSIQDK